VRIVDDKTLLMPDRRGNNLLDSLSNVLASPQVGLLFFVPGINETLRVNGRARIVTEPALLATMESHNALPQSAMEIAID
ncbi:pyridoxamine 5'-phosphate oxidase family protein, partial [Acinetobacter baumannii]